MSIAGNSRFRTLLAGTETGSEVAQDLDLWTKIQTDLDMLEIFGSASHACCVGSHFNMPAIPLGMIATAHAGGGSVTWVDGGKHAVRVLGNGAANGGYTLEYDFTAGACEPDVFFQAADASWPDFMMEFRFSTNFVWADFDLKLGVGMMTAGGNVGISSPDKGIYLEKGSASAKWKFSHKGLRGAGDASSSDISITNNDNGTTYKSARIVVLNSTTPKRVDVYYDKDGNGDWIPITFTNSTLDTLPAYPMKPFCRISRLANAVAGSVLLDSWYIRALNVKDT